MTGQMAYSFSFETTEADDRVFHGGGARRLSVLIDRRISRGIPLAVYLVLMGVLILAFHNGLLPVSVIFVAIVAFVLCDVAIRVASSLALQRAYRSHFRQAPASSRRCDVSLDDQLIVVKAGLIETRLPWAAVAKVEDAAR